MKISFVVVLSAAALLSGISAEAQVDSGGFDARGICRRPEGCVVDHGQGGSYNGPRNYRNFNGRNERDGRNDRERDNRRYRSQNRSEISTLEPTALSQALRWGCKFASSWN